MAKRGLRSINWVEAKHPRDSRGRFAKVGARSWAEKAIAATVRRSDAAFGDVHMGARPGEAPKGRLPGGLIDIKALSKAAPRTRTPGKTSEPEAGGEGKVFRPEGAVARVPAKSNKSLDKSPVARQPGGMTTTPGSAPSTRTDVTAAKTAIREHVAQELRDRGEGNLGGFIGIADTREALGDRFDQATLTKAMEELGSGGSPVRVIPVANTKALKQRDRDAAVHIGPDMNTALGLNLDHPGNAAESAAHEAWADQMRADYVKSSNVAFHNREIQRLQGERATASGKQVAAIDTQIKEHEVARDGGPSIAEQQVARNAAAETERKRLKAERDARLAKTLPEVQQAGGQASPFGAPGDPMPKRDTPAYRRAVAAIKVVGPGGGPNRPMTPYLNRAPQVGDEVTAGGLSRKGTIVRAIKRNRTDGFDVQWEGQPYTQHYTASQLQVIDVETAIRRGRGESAPKSEPSFADELRAEMKPVDARKADSGWNLDTSKTFPVATTSGGKTKITPQEKADVRAARAADEARRDASQAARTREEYQGAERARIAKVAQDEGLDVELAQTAGLGEARRAKQERRRQITGEVLQAKATAPAGRTPGASREAQTPNTVSPQPEVYDKLLGADSPIQNKSMRGLLEQMEAHGWKLTPPNAGGRNGFESMSTSDRMLGITHWTAPDGRELIVQHIDGKKPRINTERKYNAPDVTFKAAMAHIVTPTAPEMARGASVGGALENLGLPALPSRNGMTVITDPALKPFDDAQKGLMPKGAYGGQGKTLSEVVAGLRAAAKIRRESADTSDRLYGFGGSSPDSARRRELADQFERVADEMERMDAAHKASVAERERLAALPLDIRPPLRTPAKSKGRTPGGTRPKAQAADAADLDARFEAAKAQVIATTPPVGRASLDRIKTRAQKEKFLADLEQTGANSRAIDDAVTGRTPGGRRDLTSGNAVEQTGGMTTTKAKGPLTDLEDETLRAVAADSMFPRGGGKAVERLKSKGYLAHEAYTGANVDGSTGTHYRLAPTERGRAHLAGEATTPVERASKPVYAASSTTVTDAQVFRAMGTATTGAHGRALGFDPDDTTSPITAGDTVMAPGMNAYMRAGIVERVTKGGQVTIAYSTPSSEGRMYRMTRPADKVWRRGGPGARTGSVTGAVTPAKVTVEDLNSGTMSAEQAREALNRLSATDLKAMTAFLPGRNATKEYRINALMRQAKRPGYSPAQQHAVGRLGYDNTPSFTDINALEALTADDWASLEPVDREALLEIAEKLSRRNTFLDRAEAVIRTASGAKGRTPGGGR